MRRLVLAALLTTTLLACGEKEMPTPGVWPQFHGPDGNGVSAELGLPTTWSEDSDNIVWKIPIPGKGNSSPIVSHGRVFLTTAEASETTVERSVLAFDFDSGELLWQTPVGTMNKGKRHRYNTWAAPTPATDGRYIYAHFGDVLVRLDREGEIDWKKEVDSEYARYSHYGTASSPVLTEKAVIVAHDRETVDRPYAWLAAFDRKTGDQIWRVDWEQGCCSYTTPLIRRRGQIEEVIFTQSGRVVGYDAGNGEPLWSHPLEINQPVASAVTFEDLLVVFSGAHNVKFGAVLKLTGEGKETLVEELWSTNRMIPQTASPVASDGKLYTMVEQGFLVCYDIQTGRRLWERRIQGGGGFRSSLVAGDGKVYIQGGSGVTVVVRDFHKFRRLASNQIEGGGNASPALADGSILIRSSSALYRFRNDEPVPAASEG